VTYFIGGNFSFARNKIIESFETPRKDERRLSKGKPIGQRFGLEAEGFFKDNSDITKTPVHTFFPVRPGDLKYKPQKDDIRIDDDDQVLLGRWQAPWTGAVNLILTYKKLTLFLQANAQQGANGFKESNYFWVEGNRKYSEVVLNSWTPETKNTATHPRISTAANPNNHRRSDFWMYKTDFFEVNKVQLTYQLPQYIAKTVFMKRLDVFSYVTRPLIVASERQMRVLATGNSSSFNSRSFVIGVNAAF